MVEIDNDWPTILRDVAKSDRNAECHPEDHDAWGAANYIDDIHIRIAELAAENERLKQRLADYQRATNTAASHETANVSDKPEGQQEPFGYWIEHVQAEPYFLRPPSYIPSGANYKTTPLYTVPSEQAVTEVMVDVAARAIANAWGETWECCCTAKRGLDCDCGDAMVEERDVYDERLSRDDCRMAARASLNAAMEAGG